ncbi:MAG: DUF2461 domain-containing protein [Intrasporangium sp.]|uniref:DUF2461 domain-containing protein n=1 Tax=Intrasporangium sp. TaxID=1925024 RepID=UPI002647EEEC|nr:DUF2461 domain-containing protein [Intrasporangium sp.]MDN5794290.1 DUF2461 domain-containing protein [Intrasporangium sp.]
MTFSGLPHAAVDFYAALEKDNSRAFWQTERETYERDVRGPMTALLDLLEDEFGPGKVFRPNRNLRFSRDKTPYKTSQGIFVGAGSYTGWYAEVSADGFRLGGGFYHPDAPALAAYRRAVDSPDGAALAEIVEALRTDDWEVGGDRLRTAPRGWSRDHPRIDLLRHRSLTAMRSVDDPDIVTTPALAEHVRSSWRQVRPLVEWVAAAVRVASAG